MDVTTLYAPLIGQTLTCAETGKQFIATRDGCTFNFAMRNGDEIVSDEGVDISERRALLERDKPFYAYVSSDGRHVTGWKGNVLGTVTSSRTVRLTRCSYVHGATIQAIHVVDVHGGHWHGRGSPGISIKLRACK